MSTGPKVIAQLEKTIQAHRTAHHSAVRRARQYRADQQAAQSLGFLSPEQVAEPEPAAMPAGLPVQDPTDGLYDLGGDGV